MEAPVDGTVLPEACQSIDGSQKLLKDGELVLLRTETMVVIDGAVACQPVNGTVLLHLKLLFEDQLEQKVGTTKRFNFHCVDS